MGLGRSDVLDGRAESRGDADHGDCEKCNGDDDGLFELHGDAPFPFENAIEAFFGLSGAGHGDALPPNAAWRRFERGKKAENRLGVTRTVCAGGERGVVTGLFSEFREAAIEPPTEGAEPKNRAMQKRKAFGERVAAGDMRNFVRENGVELGRFPFAPSGGKQNRGIFYAEGDRDRQEFRFGEARRCAQLGCACEGVQARERLRIVNRIRVAFQAAAEADSQEQAREEEDCDGCVDHAGDGHTRKRGATSYDRSL